MHTPLLRPLSLGEVLDTAFSLYRELFLTLLFIALVSQSAGLAINIYVDRAGGIGEHIPLAMIGLLIASVGGAIGAAASTFVIADHYLGRVTDAKAALERAIPYVGQLFVLTFLTSLLFWVGLIFLIVPGVYILCGLIVATQSLVLESHRSATKAMARSWTLTKGSRGKIFLSVFVLFLLLVIPSLALLVMSVGSDDGESILPYIGIILTALLQLLVYPFFYAMMTVLYYDLRVRREGYDLEMLASSLSPT